jgi:RimJ/RimL family protein N-acetyltransferase
MPGRIAEFGEATISEYMVRWASPHDADTIRRWRDGEWSWTLEGVARRIAIGRMNERAGVLVAEKVETTAVVGTVVLSDDSLVFVYLTPDARNVGLAKLVLTVAVEHFFRSPGPQDLVLRALVPYSLQGEKLLRQLGFRANRYGVLVIGRQRWLPSHPSATLADAKEVAIASSQL